MGVHTPGSCGTWIPSEGSEGKGERKRGGGEPSGDPIVQINVYCVPILGEPEYGVSTKIGASFDGMDGLFCVGMGIDQEAAIFISQELKLV